MGLRVLARHAALTNHHHSYHRACHTAYDNDWQTQARDCNELAE